MAISLSKNRVIGFAAGLLVLAAFLIIWGQLSKQPQPQTPASPNIPDIPAPQAPPDQSPAGRNDPNLPSLIEGPQPLVSGVVGWEYPKKIAGLGLMKSDEYINGEASTDYYKLGSFKSGKYAGGELIYLFAPCDGLCVPQNYRMVRLNGKYYLLKKHSDELYEGSYLDQTKIDIDNDYVISDLVFPENLTGPNNANLALMARQAFSQAVVFLNSKDLVKVYDDPQVGRVYTDSYAGLNPEGGDRQGQNGFYVQAPDGSKIIYALKPNFVGDNRVPQIVWNDGTANQQEYAYTDIGGCGSENYAAVVTGLNLATDLVAAGFTSKGSPVFILKDRNHQLLKDRYDFSFAPSDPADPNSEKISYQDFLNSRPLFFWIDPFGRLIKFTNARFQPLAECAKPVIYLYPQTETVVEVKLDPQGGFTYTEPLYENGWTVRAKPAGELIEISSGKTYPYLFWEGRGGIYKTPEKGWVVEQAEVSGFLIEKLTQLGLNEKEQADFLEYWLPYFQSSPYYFITFLGNQAADAIAPLKVDPKPDTVIRVLMDFQPLQKPIAAQGFNIRTPARRGFTVIEWGGVKH